LSEQTVAVAQRTSLGIVSGGMVATEDGREAVSSPLESVVAANEAFREFWHRALRAGVAPTAARDAGKIADMITVRPLPQ
jgi:hypothetical protein